MGALCSGRTHILELSLAEDGDADFDFHQQNPKTSTPVAVYKDGEGGVHKFSALCPHLKGVVCWNKSEESWDCPIHGSRFSKDGIQVMGPAKANLSPIDESGKATQQQAVEA